MTVPWERGLQAVRVRAGAARVGSPLWPQLLQDLGERDDGAGWNPPLHVAGMDATGSATRRGIWRGECERWRHTTKHLGEEGENGSRLSGDKCRIRHEMRHAEIRWLRGVIYL